MDSLVQIGAGLEQIAVNLPEDYSAANALLILCLKGLQAIFEGNARNVEHLIRLTASALIAVEQAIVSTPNPISDAMLKHAQEGIAAELESKQISNDAEEISRESAESLTLDGVATLLLQISLEDKDEIVQIREALKRLSSEAMSSTVKKLLTKAAREANKILSGKAESADETFTQIGILIERASNEIEGVEVIEHKTEQVKQDVAVEIHKVETPPQISAQKPVEEKTIKLVPAPAQNDYEPDVLADDADKNLLTEFVIESKEGIEAAESALLTLETEPDNLDNINTVFRAFHTIKGSSAFLGLKRLTELAHLAESLLSRIREGEIRCTGGYATLALRSIDALKEMFVSVQDALEGGLMTLPDSYADLIRILSNPEAAGVTGESDNSSETIEVKESEFADKAMEKLHKTTRLGDILVGMKKVTAEQVDAIVETKGTHLLGTMLVNAGLVTSEDVEEALQIQKRLRSEKKQSVNESSVRVRTDRLDRLIDMVGELVVAQSMLAQDETLMQSSQFELVRKVAHAGKIVRDLQDLSMAMRMIPLKNTFGKMARVVRDVAQKCGKSVEFVTEGEDTEIDRNMVDLIADPLVHMVRNAVDHGVELPDDREEKGKPRTGKVRLSAYHAGGNVVVELADDGNGLDSEKILQKALDKGLVEADKVLTENQIFNLIFAPGMSTVETVTDVSGRGVGMDVVRRNIEAMHGRVEISSEKGKGSLFTIRLPLTLAITDGMLVRVGTERYIVPTVHIHLSFRPSANAISTVTGRGEMVHLRGELMPIVRLHELFNVEGAAEDLTEGLLMIVADDKRRCALLVDELLGQHQVVAKALGSGIGKIQGVAGGAILGDGCVGLILDTAELVALARQNTSATYRKYDLSHKVA